MFERGELDQYNAFQARCVRCYNYRDDYEPGHPDRYCPLWNAIQAYATGGFSRRVKIMSRDEVKSYLVADDKEHKYTCTVFDEIPEEEKPEQRLVTEPFPNEVMGTADDIPEGAYIAPAPPGLNAIRDSHAGPIVLLGSGPSIIPHVRELKTEERLGIEDALYLGTNGAAEFADYGIWVETLSKINQKKMQDVRRAVITRKIVDIPELCSDLPHYYLSQNMWDHVPRSYHAMALRQPGALEAQAGTAAFYAAWAIGGSPIICIGFDFAFTDRTHYYQEDKRTRDQGANAYQWAETNLITCEMWKHITKSGREVIVVSNPPGLSRFLLNRAPRMSLKEVKKYLREGGRVGCQNC